jgi:hypothetical protein
MHRTQIHTHISSAVIRLFAQLHREAASLDYPTLLDYNNPNEPPGFS